MGAAGTEACPTRGSATLEIFGREVDAMDAHLTDQAPGPRDLIQAHAERHAARDERLHRDGVFSLAHAVDVVALRRAIVT